VPRLARCGSIRSPWYLRSGHAPRRRPVRRGAGYPGLAGGSTDGCVREPGGGPSGGTRRLSQGFVVAQFALSLILLVGAGLLPAASGAPWTVDPGFRPENVLAARVQLPWPKYANDTVVRCSRTAARVGRIPSGVHRAGLVNRVPFSRGIRKATCSWKVRFHDRASVPVINMRGRLARLLRCHRHTHPRSRGFLPSDVAARPGRGGG
jgi:hypothetical protein